MQYRFTELAKTLMRENAELRESPQIDTIDLDVIDFTPRRGTPNSSGFDLSACLDKELRIYPNEKYKISTGIHLWIGSDSNISLDMPREVLLAGQLMPRSSIEGLMLTNAVGLADHDYQGEYIAKVFNYTDNIITVKPGQKLVQLVFIFTYIPELVLASTEWIPTERNNGGFGHTGK